MLLRIDNRENPARVKHVVSSFNETAISTEITQLDVCDYVGVDKDKILFGIEYKTYDDFTSSIANGHLVSQLNDMEGMEHPFLFVVGSYAKWITKPVRANLSLDNISIEFSVVIFNFCFIIVIQYNCDQKYYLGKFRIV